MFAFDLLSAQNALRKSVCAVMSIKDADFGAQPCDTGPHVPAAITQMGT